ncbi:microtubule-associated protein 10-like [Branchiostoma lanceolatum]|uniref:microtubule-associated protein 10-like n=1 Tax=Branchiostoma lanceolatum TaxID=7740 RepID=UPI0034554B64
METETLFSFEVVVESVQIRGVVQCRLPAVAFRLLDFPTLLIRHDVTEAALRMRELGINSDPTWAPIEEEHGKAGRFEFGKGKSCLLRMRPEVLREHLRNIPLYVMVIDSWSDVPRLVGNSSVPLTSSMELVYQDIQSDGITSPSVHGEKGEFPLHNLMGTQIGTVEMGYRLMSLGTMLMQHVPRDAVMQRRGVEGREERETPKEAEIETPASKPSEGDILVAKATQYEYDRADSPPTVATQTEAPQKHRKAKVKEDVDSMSDNNIICPPPLFYNSMAADPPQKAPKPKSAPPTGRVSYDIADFYSEIGESSEEENKDPQTRGVKVERGVQTSQNVNVQAGHEDNQGPPISLPAGLPLLRQLFSELSVLEGRSVGMHVFESQHPAPREEARVRISRPETAPPKPPAAQPVERTKERPAPLHGSPLRVRHQPCARGDAPVPKTRSWIRQVPQAPVRGRGRSKLRYGMTHSLRLRIQQSNPAWLEKMEGERTLQQHEIDRPQRPPRRPLEQIQQPSQQRPSEQTITVSRRPGRRGDVYGREVRSLIGESGVLFDKAAVLTETVVTDEKHEARRKPVPTPRQHSHSEIEDHEQEEPLPFDRSLVEMETPKVDVGFGTTGSSESENQSKKSIQVFLPLVPNQDESEIPDDSLDQQDLEGKESNKTEKKQAMSRQDAVSEPESGHSYSEDFEEHETHDEYSTAASHMSHDDTSESVKSDSPPSQASTTVEKRRESTSKPKRDVLEDRRSPDSVASGRSDRSRYSAFSQASSRPRAGSFGLGAPPPPTPSKSPVMGVRQSSKKALPTDTRTSNDEDSQANVDRNGSSRPPPRIVPRDRKISTNTASVSSYVPSHLSTDIENLSTEGSLDF